MAYEIKYPRTIDKRRPVGHVPRAPRYRLTWDEPLSGVACVYFGLQCPLPSTAIDENVEKEFLNTLSCFFECNNAPSVVETLRCKDISNHFNTIIVTYWSDITEFALWLDESAFKEWFKSKKGSSLNYGYWFEPIVSHFDRFETIYSESHYRVGLGLLPNTKIEPMTDNGYFGAARDRLPLSAIDSLDGCKPKTRLSNILEKSNQEHIISLLQHNLVVLRSGQFWGNAGKEQADDYLETMQPRLEKGMAYLKCNPIDTGCLSLRMMTNIDDDGKELAETSTLAIFQSLADLERWSSSHETHLNIYEHAIKMNRHYGKDREVVTWHELFVLQHGSAFEYINCHSKTGMLSYSDVAIVDNTQ